MRRQGSKQRKLHLAGGWGASLFAKGDSDEIAVENRYGLNPACVGAHFVVCETKIAGKPKIV